MKLVVSEGPDAAAEACATWIAEQLEHALSGDTAAVAFSGGRTPARMLEELGKQDVDWARVHVFQVDERLVREGDPDRNLSLLQRHLLPAVTLPVNNLHPMPVGIANLDEAAQRYQRVLEEVCGRPPVLDVVVLGLGTDGHTASLMPGDPALDVDDDAVAVTAAHGGYRRLTLTLPTLRRARHVAWLVVGQEKAGALAELLGGGDVIAARVGRDDALVFADENAAAARPREAE